MDSAARAWGLSMQDIDDFLDDENGMRKPIAKPQAKRVIPVRPKLRPPGVAGPALVPGGEKRGVKARPTITIKPGERARVVAELAAALAEGAPYFRRGSILVRAISLPADDDTAGVHRERGAILLRQAKLHGVIADASSVARVEKYDARRSAYVETDLPADAAAAFVEIGVEQKAIRPVVGVVRCPVMREDGSLLSAGGYDPVTRLILAGNEDWRQLDIIEKPTRDDALCALQFLAEGPYRDFPFVDSVSRSVAVSALFTAVLRPALDCAPLHGFSAPSFGAGKSLQAAFAALIATGQRPAMVAPGHDQQELEKRVDSLILAGDPVVVLDNLSRPLGGDNICAALTSSRASVRPLGSSTTIEIPTSGFWMATGANLAMRGDMVRRAVVGCIDPAVERPETRSGFAIPQLLDWAAENRMRVLSAVYTVLRAHAQAGYPSGGEKTLGNFEAWSRRVAHCLVWLGWANPVRSQERLHREDPQEVARVAVMTALLEWQRGRENYALSTWTAAEVKKAASIRVRSDERELGEAIDSLPNKAASLDYWLRTNRGVVLTLEAGPCRLTQAETKSHGVARWHVSPIGTDDAPA
jgi:putative DNA primase/helicase